MLIKWYDESMQLPADEEAHSEFPLQDRFVDVPICKLHRGVYSILYDKTWTHEYAELFSIPIYQCYSVWADGFVSKKTIEDIGYNGVVFTRNRRFHELSNYKQKLVQETWP